MKDKFPFTFQGGQTCHVQVSDSGTTVALQIDGQQVYGKSWSNVPSGGVRFKCKTGTCDMDNVVIQ